MEKKFVNTREALGLVFSSWKYKFFTFILGFVFFGFLYYFLVSNVAENSLWISIMMSGPLFITLSVGSIIITSILSAILISMTIFKFKNYNKLGGKGFFGFIGSGIAALGFGCPTCGAFLFGLVGVPLALMYLPFRGLELQIFGIFILILSVYFTGKSINGFCKINKN